MKQLLIYEQNYGRQYGQIIIKNKYEKKVNGLER
jgi:hypothetical protein